MSAASDRRRQALLGYLKVLVEDKVITPGMSMSMTLSVAGRALATDILFTFGETAIASAAERLRQMAYQSESSPVDVSPKKG